MVDYSGFSNNNFSVTDWINTNLREFPEEDNAESFLSSIGMKLHLLSQDYADQLESAMIESLSSVPRIMGDIIRYEDQLHTINEEIKNLSSMLTTLDQRNVSGVEELMRLDRLKGNMQKCKATLEEHARWSQLVRETKAMLESGGRLVDSADRVETMFKSLEILKSLPGNEERDLTCQEFKNSLLNAIRPQVRRDIIQLDLNRLQEYRYVFTKLDRENEFQQEYIKTRPDSVKAVWDHPHHTEQSKDEFAKWIASFLGSVTKLAHDEIEIIPELFGKSQGPNVLNALLCEAVSPMRLSLGGFLIRIDSPSTAYDCYQVIEEFSRRIFKLTIESLPPDEVISTLSVIYGSLMEYSANYSESEVKSLKDTFRQILDGIHFKMDATDFLTMMDEQSSSEGRPVPHVGQGHSMGMDPHSESFLQFSERLLLATDSYVDPILLALKRGTTFMGGIRIKQMMKSVTATLTLFTKHIMEKVEQLSEACGFPKEKGLSTAGDGDSAETEVWGGVGAGVGTVTTLWESSELDGKNLITCALRCLQAMGRFVKRFETVLEPSAKSLLLDLYSALFTSNLSSSSQAISLKTSIESILTSHPSKGSSSSSIGSIFASYLLCSDSNGSSELKSFLVSLTSSSHHLSNGVFSSIKVSIDRLKLSAGTLLFRTCLSVPIKLLANFANEDDIWQSQCTEEMQLLIANESSYAEKLSVLKENLLPQSLITQVGEHMLSLVQELESFVSSDALEDLVQLRGEAPNLIGRSKGWQQFKKILEIRDDDILDQVCKRNLCSSIIVTLEKSLFGGSMSLGGNEIESGNVHDAGIETPHSVLSGSNCVLGVVNDWLGGVADAVVGIFLVQMMNMKKLSWMGCAQLLIDLEYLSNVIQAMGIRSHPMISHVQYVLQQDPIQLVDRLSLLQGKNVGLNAIIAFDQMIVNSMDCVS